LLKLVHNKIWFFDIEWVPDAAVGRRLYNCDSGISDQEVMSVMWANAGATEENPRPFLKVGLCRIASIAFVFRQIHDGEPHFSLHSLPTISDLEATESTIIDNFFSYASKHLPQFVGFSSTNSDIHILVQRAMANELCAGRVANRPDKPWEGFDYFAKYSDAHVDLQELLGYYGKGNTPSLNEVAATINVPGKIDVDGGQVVDLWNENNIRKIVEYNEFDVLTTYLVWLRLAKFSGKVDEESYLNEVKIFKKFLENLLDEKPHLQKFLEKWEIE